MELFQNLDHVVKVNVGLQRVFLLVFIILDRRHFLLLVLSCPIFLGFVSVFLLVVLTRGTWVALLLFLRSFASFLLFDKFLPLLWPKLVKSVDQELNIVHGIDTETFANRVDHYQKLVFL